MKCSTFLFNILLFPAPATKKQVLVVLTNQNQVTFESTNQKKVLSDVKPGVLPWLTVPEDPLLEEDVRDPPDEVFPVDFKPRIGQNMMQSIVDSFVL